jgi:hypothetical protein
MSDVDHLRDCARRCRGLSKIAIEPDVIEQLRVWAVDFADEADEEERRAAEREEAEAAAYHRA